MIRFIFICFLFACQNSPSNYRNSILDQFDSVNRSLDKTNDLVTTSTHNLYDSLEIKFAGTDKYNGIRQFYYHINDFYGYINNLEWQFKIACGDSKGQNLLPENEDKFSITNDFFLNKKHGEVLYQQLEFVRAQLNEHTDKDSVKLLNNKLGDIPGERSAANFARYYFNNVPPVAAITILNSFEQTVKNIEIKILSEYLTQNIENLKIDILKNLKE